MKTMLIEQIIRKEWDFFDTTNNIEGRAICQQYPENFLISRKMYLQIFNEDILCSYLEDLAKAELNNQNLITNKYGYMMQFTDKENYSKIKDTLIPVEESKRLLIELIVPICLKWEAEVVEEYGGKENYAHRPLYATADSNKITSVETYFRGELMSYSLKTLQKILSYFQAQQELGNNRILISRREC